MQIFLRGRNTIVIDVEASDTVLSIKEKIRDREGIPVAYLSLSTGGKMMEDVRLLSEYGIQAESTIEYRIRSG
jgi:hypothetical protein